MLKVDPFLLFISFFFFLVWLPTSENKIFDVVLLSVSPAPTPPSLFSHSAVSQSCTYTYVHPHTLFLSQTHTHTHDHRGENQANRPHEFLLKWDYWNGSPRFSMSIIACYAGGDKSIYFPSGSRSNYSCSLLHTWRWNSGSQPSLVNNMLDCLSGFNMRCQLGLTGVWQVSQTDTATTFRADYCSWQDMHFSKGALTYFCLDLYLQLKPPN